MIARLLQAAQAQAPQQSAPSPVDSLLFDRSGMGAPENGFSGSSGTVVGAQPPQAQAAPAPAPQTTGALPKPPAPAPQGEDADEAPAPAARAVPLPPARPAGFTSLADAAAAPANSFDPLTGQPVSGSPKPVGAPPAAAPVKPADDHSFLKAWQSLGNSGIGDQLLALSAGLLSGGGAEGWSRGISGMLAAGQNAGKADLERAKAQAELSKQQRELAGQNQTAKIISQRLGMPLEDATALAMNPQFVQGFLSSQYGAPQNFRVNADGSQSFVPGSQADPSYKAAEAQAGREPIAEAAARAGAVTKATTENSGDTVETQQVPGVGLVAVNKDKVLSDDPAERAAAYGVISSTPGARVWGQPGPDGQIVQPPPGTPPGTPGAYDEKGMPHVALTQGTNQLPQKANAELDQAAVKAITESRAKAEGAIGTIAAINRQKEAIDKGIVSGAGADWRTQARAVAAQVLGIPDSYVTQSQLFDQAATQKSAELAKAISQSGHTTNMDLQLGKTISSGDRSSVEAALRAGIEAQEILAKNTIAHHNASVDRFATPETAQRAGFFKVEQPEIYQYRPAAPDRAAVEAEMRRRGMMR
ncbi:MAG: hypothetical protein MIL41_19670 [Hyphomicrobiales bacterium]